MHLSQSLTNLLPLQVELLVAPAKEFVCGEPFLLNGFYRPISVDAGAEFYLDIFRYTHASRLILMWDSGHS